MHSSLLQRGRSKKPRLRRFDTELPSSHRYEVRFDNHLESVANARTAADLHVRPVSQTPLVERIVGAANDLRNTRWAASRNQFDSRLAASPHSICPVVMPIFQGKPLNQRADSRASGAATNPATLAKIFNKFFTSDCR
jgi:hypothetical protein